MRDEGDSVAVKSVLSKALLASLLGALLAALPYMPASANYASVVMDASTGHVLYQANADLPRYPASLTKIMSLYLLFEALDEGRVTLDQPLSVSGDAAAKPPTKLGLRAGQWITVEDALLGLVTKSANDAAAVIAENLAGSEPRFAWMMTAKAHSLGMSQTMFANASGLPDPNQVTTARDMAILALALLHDYPHYYHYFSTDRFYYRGAVHTNHNRMLGEYPGLDGIKTGYTYASGFNLVASAQRNGRRMIGVVMGARSPGTRNLMMASLLDQAFDGGEILVTEQGEDPPVLSALAAAGKSSLTARSRKRVAAARSRAVKVAAARSRAVQVAAARSRAVKVAARPPSSKFSNKPTAKVLGKSAAQVMAAKATASRKGRVTSRSADAGRMTATKARKGDRLALVTANKPKVAAAASASKSAVQSRGTKGGKSISSVNKRRVADVGRRPSS